MELFLVPNDPERTVLVSANGVAHYQVRTSKIKHGPWVSVIRRPAETEEDSIVAEVEWRCWKAPTIIQCPLLSNLASRIGKRGFGVPASTFLYKQCRSSSYVLFYSMAGTSNHSDIFSTRYFLGNDGVEYRWKDFKGVGMVVRFLVVPSSRLAPLNRILLLTKLTRSDTGQEVARYSYEVNEEGLFAGEKKSRIRIQPCSVDIDLVVLSFVIVEKKKRDHAGDGTRRSLHDEDPLECGMDGGIEG